MRIQLARFGRCKEIVAVLDEKKPRLGKVQVELLVEGQPFQSTEIGVIENDSDGSIWVRLNFESYGVQLAYASASLEHFLTIASLHFDVTAKQFNRSSEEAEYKAAQERFEDWIMVNDQRGQLDSNSFWNILRDGDF